MEGARAERAPDVGLLVRDTLPSPDTRWSGRHPGDTPVLDGPDPTTGVGSETTTRAEGSSPVPGGCCV